ncbi:MAG: hypothetical protein HY815_13685 [Candidatus Riflebacteria bacterium]|nr:hypothetical protein [Candidatus Riflebacteria bacterium]
MTSLVLSSRSMLDLYEELGQIVDTLNRAGVRFALCGGLAVVLHGYIRATKDIEKLENPDE